MSRSIVLRDSHVLGKKELGAIFGIGILLGSVVFGMRVYLTDTLPGHAVTDVRTVSQLSAMAPPPMRTGYTVEQRTEQPTNSSIAQSPEQPGQAQFDVAEVGDTAKEVQMAAASSPLLGVNIRVYLSAKKSVVNVPLEEYVKGVLAAEMPIAFELEALKAQAIAARTYIVRRLILQDGDSRQQGRYDVTDTVKHQVYLSPVELDKRWSGSDKDVHLAKLKQAVDDTAGLIVTYDGEPIEAAFFSTSNGYTENSEEYWELSLPYLRSVASPWDEALSPRYEQEVELSLSSFYRKLGLQGESASAKLVMTVEEWTDGKRIKRIRVNGHSFSGRELREKLGLASSEFNWEIEKDSITLITYGMGHGVGMSQWGANGMAREGATAEQILRHYYTDITVEQASKLPI